MLQKLIKKHNHTIQKALSEAISEGLRHETTNLQRLEGNKLQNFVTTLSLQLVTEPEIYYNNFNMLICQKEVFDQMSGYLKESNLVMRMVFPKLDVYVWCYEIFQDPLFYNLLDDVKDTTK